jgi:hypothetical protein
MVPVLTIAIGARPPALHPQWHPWACLDGCPQPLPPSSCSASPSAFGSYTTLDIQLSLTLGPFEIGRSALPNLGLRSSVDGQPVTILHRPLGPHPCVDLLLRWFSRPLGPLFLLSHAGSLVAALGLEPASVPASPPGPPDPPTSRPDTFSLVGVCDLVALTAPSTTTGTALHQSIQFATAAATTFSVADLETRG